MQNLTFRYVFDRKKESSNTKKGLLQIEVRVSGTSKKMYISTGVRLNSNQFSDKNGFTCKNHPNSLLITGKVRKIFNTIEAFCLSDSCPTFGSVKNWNADPSKTFSVIDFIADDIKKTNPPKDHKALLTRLTEFEKIKTFSDLTYDNIEDFDLFLKKYINAQPVLFRRHKCFEKYIKKAIKKKLCQHNPYDDFDLVKGRYKDPTFLEDFEINKIMEYHPQVEKLQHTKDLFLIQIFTGVSYCDLQGFKGSIF